MTYFEPTKTKFIPKKIKAVLRKREFEFYTSSSIFSKSKVDKGTEVLANYCEPKGKVLDLGCGYGVVGIIVKKFFPEAEVIMSDVNARAVKLTKMNLKLNGVEAEAVVSDLFEKHGKFDTILTNPPYVAGRVLCTRFVKESFEHLNKGGSLQLVARHNKGGKYFEELIGDIFGNVKTIAKKSGYRIYVGTRED